MTILIANIAEEFIALTADSVFTEIYSNSEVIYKDGKKVHPIQGVGIVATWGQRHERIWQYIRECKLRPEKSTVIDLRDCVWNYLTNILKPHEVDYPEIAYYVLGFDKDKKPRFYHLRWGFVSRSPTGEEKKDYHSSYNQHDSGIKFTYDGKFGIADDIFNTFFKEVTEGGSVPYDVLSLVGRAQINDFVIRVVSEISKEVGPPFRNFYINHNNKIEGLINKSLCPLNPRSINKRINKLRTIQFSDK